MIGWNRRRRVQIPFFLILFLIWKCFFDRKDIRGFTNRVCKHYSTTENLHRYLVELIDKLRLVIHLQKIQFETQLLPSFWITIAKGSLRINSVKLIYSLHSSPKQYRVLKVKTRKLFWFIDAWDHQEFWVHLIFLIRKATL